jgi:hypothetical protein
MRRRAFLIVAERLNTASFDPNEERPSLVVQARGPFARSSDHCGKCRHAES